MRHLPKIFKIWKHATDTKELDKECGRLEEWGELRRTPRIKVQACAVWDTVSTIGMPVLTHIPKPPRRTYLRLTKAVTPNIKLAIQALALDETRRHFDAEVWVPPENSDQKLVQCWFAGCHADIGGDEQNSTLANICLAWMVGQLTDIVHFNVQNLWTITTTRDWSKPTAEIGGSDDLPDRCQIEATSALSRELRMPYLHIVHIASLTENSTIPHHLLFGNPACSRWFHSPAGPPWRTTLQRLYFRRARNRSQQIQASTKMLICYFQLS